MKLLTTMPSIGVFLLVLMSPACKTRIKDDHSKYLERFFLRFDAEPYHVRTRMLDSLDLVIRHHPANAVDRAHYYRVKASYYLVGRNYKQAFLYFDSVDIARQHIKNEQIFTNFQRVALLGRSECYRQLKNYDAAMKYLLHAKMIIAEDDCTRLLQVDSRIAGILYEQGRFNLAAGYYVKLFEDGQKCKGPDKDQLFADNQRYLDNVGLCYAAVGMLDSAMYYYNATLNYINANETAFPQKADYIKLAKAVVYGNIGKIKALQNDFKAAETYSLISIEGTRGQDNGFTLTTRLQLANLYISWNKIQKAQKLLYEIDSLHRFSTRGGMDEKRMEWNLAMKKLFEKTGNLPQAYLYNNQYLAIRDSLDVILKRDISRDIGKEFENMEQRAINDKLETSNREKSFQLAIALLTAVLAIAIGLFVWYNLRRSSKHVKQLQKLNSQIQEKNNDLMQAFASLETSHAENTRMTRMVAHDLKNPIGGIRTLVYTLLHRNQPEELHKMLELIYSTCSNSINVINDLLKEKGSLADVRKEMVDLRRLMKYCVDLLQTKSEEKKQELHLVADKAIMIRASREKIWRVMSNLISNAIKFSPEHSTIDIALERKEKTVLLSVKDHGIGIPEDLRDKIFTRSPEASRTGTAGEESHGLGLYITQQIVEEHKGKIWFESEEYKGCTFYVELPLN